MSLNINGNPHADTISTTKKSAGNKDIISFLKKVKLPTRNKIKSQKNYLKYKKKFLQQGFINHKGQSFDRPQCILCGHVFSNKFLKTLRLAGHLTNVHLKHSEEKLEFFELKKRIYNKTKEISSTDTQVDKALLASFKISYFIAKCKKNFTIAEDLILPSTIVIVSELFGENSADSVKIVKLSNDTVKRRIDMIHTDIKEQLVER